MWQVLEKMLYKCKLIFFFLNVLLRTLGPNVQAMLSLNISKRLSQKVFVLFLENVTLENSGNLTKTSC